MGKVVYYEINLLIFFKLYIICLTGLLGEVNTRDALLQAETAGSNCMSGVKVAKVLCALLGILGHVQLLELVSDAVTPQLLSSVLL